MQYSNILIRTVVFVKISVVFRLSNSQNFVLAFLGNESSFRSKLLRIILRISSYELYAYVENWKISSEIIAEELVRVYTSTQVVTLIIYEVSNAGCVFWVSKASWQT